MASSAADAMQVDEQQPLTHKQRTRAEQHESLPWVEKYRPSDMSDLVSHEDIISTITRLIDAGKLPHLLLYGPPGTGKTSTILACAHKLYGKNFHAMVLELNASDDRGLDVVREKIKEFASTRIMFSSAPKMIILDEADNMTSAAQAALRRVIEKYTKNARFCLICNYASKIIPALQSRCTRFRFAPLAQEQCLGRVRIIADAEQVKYDESGLQACVRLADGDMRRVINVLQSTHMSSDLVDESSVYTCTGAPLPQDVHTILKALLEDDFTPAVQTIWTLMSDKGLALQDILSGLLHHVVLLEAKDRLAQANLVASLADLEQRLSLGTNDKMQLAGMVGLFQTSRNQLVGVKA